MITTGKCTSLFEEIKNIRFRESYEEWLEPRSADPDVLYEIQNKVGYPITRAQIRFILERVPDVFAPGWMYPTSFGDLSDKEKKACDDLVKYGYFPIPLFYIERVIEVGMEFRSMGGAVK